MKKKLILIVLAFTFILIGCYNKKISEKSTTISITQQEDEKISYNKFLTINGKYEFEDINEIARNNYNYKLENNELSQLENGKNIKIKFPNTLPKDNKIYITKTYVEPLGKCGTNYSLEDMIVDIDKDGFANFNHTSNNKEVPLEFILYEITINWEDISSKYTFAFKV